MKILVLSRINLTRPQLISSFSMASLMLSMTFFCQLGQAQQAQLSLADILIGLRSKKVSLDERNRLLSDAVKVRGITFSLTPEIETELAGTGASVGLVDAIRQKSSNIKISAVTKPATIVPTAPTPDFAFYRKRADENIGKGEFDSAVSDYSKAIELNPKDAATYLNRGRAYSNKKSYDLAMLDYDKWVELSPKETTAYFTRGDLHEKRGNLQLAMSDYRKAIELDAANESAKISLKRLQDAQAKIEQARIEQEKIEQAKVLAKQKETEAALAAQTSKVPEKSNLPKTVELGSLVAQAVRMIVPVYPAIARQSKIVGQVTVQITVDEKGNVIAAKASNGPSMLRGASEEAARRTKFKPALVANEAVKSTGYITYNFTGN